MKLRLIAIVALTSTFAVPAVADAPKTNADQAASVAAFSEAAKVLASPRCMNCHTLVDWPTQGDDRHRHTFNVMRGPDNRGVPGMQCANCHKDANQEAMTIPGAKDWHMAPIAMGWTGLTPGQLCKTLLDTKKNGGLTGEKVIEHMRSDRLVLWAWSPGGARKPPELDHKTFVAALETWLKKGAHCPAP
jgi:hypothetical protein